MNTILRRLTTPGTRRIAPARCFIHSMSSLVAGIVCAAALLVAAPAARAQMTGSGTSTYKQEPGAAAASVPSPLRDVGFDQNIGHQLPLDTVFRDEQGREVRIGDYFGHHPVVLVFAYFDCPMLCTQVINGLSSALGVLSLNPGKDFEILTVSFNPHDNPQSATVKKAIYLKRYKKPGAAQAWHFLTGDQPSIDRLTKAAGFRYVWDEETKQYAHPTGIMVVTPQGKIARYLFGIEYGPRDLRLALIDASGGKLGTPVDQLVLYCYHYNPITGRYGFAIQRALQIGGAGTVLGLGALIILLIRKDKNAPPVS
jgi:protein SCO1/2